MVIHEWNIRCFHTRKRCYLPCFGQRAQVVLSQSVPFPGLSSLGPGVAAPQRSQGISSGLQPGSCKLLKDSHERGLSWINCPGSSNLVSATLFSTPLLGCSQLFLQAGAVGAYLCNTSCCGSRVACSQANRADTCSKPFASWSRTSSCMLGWSEVQPHALGGRQYTVLLCRWEKWHCPTRKHGHQVRCKGRKMGQWLCLKLIKTLYSGNIHFIITGSYYE